MSFCVSSLVLKSKPTPQITTNLLQKKNRSPDSDNFVFLLLHLPHIITMYIYYDNGLPISHIQNIAKKSKQNSQSTAKGIKYFMYDHKARRSDEKRLT